MVIILYILSRSRNRNMNQKSKIHGKSLRAHGKNGPRETKQESLWIIVNNREQYGKKLLCKIKKNKWSKKRKQRHEEMMRRQWDKRKTKMSNEK